MPQTVALSDFRTAIRDQTDTDDDFLGNAKLDIIINRAIGRTHRFILRHNEDWFLKHTPATVNVVSGDDVYDLPPDVLLIRGVDVKEQDGDWTNMHPFNWGERNLLQQVGADRLWTRYKFIGGKIRLMPVPSWSGELRVYYVTVPPKLVKASDKLNAFGSYEEAIIHEACVIVTSMQDLDPSQFIALLKDSRQDLKQLVQRQDLGEPDRVRDAYAERSSEGYNPSYWRP
jgi:hypothetical protein